MTDSEYFTLDENGDLLCINIHTGEETLVPVGSEVPKGANAPLVTRDKYIQVKNDVGEIVWVPRTIGKSDLKEIQGSNYNFPYSQLLADRICVMVAEGRTLTEICKQAGYPSYSQLCRWRREFPEFAEGLREAREDRAEMMFDKALSTIENAGADRDEINLAKAKSDMYRHAAKVYSPRDFGDKQQIKAEVGIGHVVIDTGIRRAGDAGYNLDETKKLNEGEDSGK